MLFRKAIENAIPSGIAVIDDTGKQIYANQSFCKMVGFEEEELIGKRPPYEYWAQQDIENINNALKKLLIIMHQKKDLTSFFAVKQEN